jgi:hypothetical protein
MSTGKEHLDVQQFNIIFLFYFSTKSSKMWDCFIVLSDTVLSKKWKYLRDQFSVEFGKIKPPRSGYPEGESYEPKWPRYRSLLFLKDVVKPRASSSN